MLWVCLLEIVCTIGLCDVCIQNARDWAKSIFFLAAAPVACYSWHWEYKTWSKLWERHAWTWWQIEQLAYYTMLHVRSCQGLHCLSYWCPHTSIQRQPNQYVIIIITSHQRPGTSQQFGKWVIKFFSQSLTDAGWSISICFLSESYISTWVGMTFSGEPGY